MAYFKNHITTYLPPCIHIFQHPSSLQYFVLSWDFCFQNTALFTTAKTWKQPRCLLVDKWIRKLWNIYTMAYYSPVIKNTFESFLMRWTKLECIIQSEVSHKEKYQYSILTHVYGIYKDGNDDPICETAKETQI